MSQYSGLLECTPETFETIIGLDSELVCTAVVEKNFTWLASWSIVLIIQFVWGLFQAYHVICNFDI